MLNIVGPASRLCDGNTRRGFLKVGALGMGGLSLPGLWLAQSARGAAPVRDTAVIMFWMAGGPSHIDMVDMKPKAPDKIRGPFQPIATNLPGLDVCELMPRHASIANHLAVVRSMHHGYGIHDDAQHLVQTGHALPNARLRGQQQPAEGAVASYLRGPNQPGMPAYVCVPEDYSTHMGFYQSAVYLGARHNALNAGGDPSLGNYRPPEFNLPQEMTVERLQNRRGLLRRFDELVRAGEQDGSLQALSDVQQKAFDLVTGSSVRKAFDLSQEPAELRERYGKHAPGQSALMARRLVEAGSTFVTINLYEKDVDWWDDHTTIEKNLRKRLPQYDQAFCTLIEDLRDRGQLDRVLVLAWGEFGRSPQIDAGAGRGHWPRAMHATLAGGGIRGGQIIGSTTPDGGDPRDRPLVPGDMLASVYRVLGIDHDQFLTDRQNRPIRLVEQGQPIGELF
ncbi:MAG: DUF1501 domain-containing protein [Pirellulales bacterium]